MKRWSNVHLLYFGGVTLVEITIDTRERAQDRAKIIKGFPKTKYPDIIWKEVALKEGDFLIRCNNGNNNSVLIERKSISDLYGSMMGSKGKPGRLNDQLNRLLTHQTDKVVILLVTGSINEYITYQKKRGNDIDPDVFDSIIASVMCRYNIRVLVDDNNANGIKRALKCAMKICAGEQDIISKRNCDALTARLLNITLIQWRAIRNTHGTDLTYIAKLSDAELTAIDGIGKIKAQRIKNVLCGKSNDWLT